MLLLYFAKWNALLAATQQRQKGTKFHTQKNRSLLLHTVELSTALVKVDIKVINANLTLNKCLQYVQSPLTHAEIGYRDRANDGMIKLDDFHYQTEPNLSIFPKEI